MIIELNDSKKLEINLNVREWCKLPYPGHPKGCPNYGKSKKCPPKIGLVYNVFDLTKPIWLCVVEFNMNAHEERMKEKHPNWTKKQCRCCLYWQNTVRKKLRTECNEFLQDKQTILGYTLIPEAMGVNMFKTAINIGIKLDRIINDKLYKIALIGTYKKE